MECRRSDHQLPLFTIRFTIKAAANPFAANPFPGGAMPVNPAMLGRGVFGGAAMAPVVPRGGFPGGGLALGSRRWNAGAAVAAAPQETLHERLMKFRA